MNGAFTILYDGECPFCVREINWLRRRDKKSQLSFADISTPHFDASRYGLTREQVNKVIHGVFPDGRVIRKMDVFRHVYRVVGMGWLATLLSLPILRFLADRFYEFFARNRVQFGKWFGRGCSDDSCRVS